MRSDECLKNLCLTKCQQEPQLFYKHKNGNIVLILANIIDGVKAAGSKDNSKIFIEKANESCNIGSISHGPGQLRFFGKNTVQDDKNTVLYQLMLMTSSTH